MVGRGQFGGMTPTFLKILECIILRDLEMRQLSLGHVSNLRYSLILCLKYSQRLKKAREREREREEERESS